MRRTLTLLRLGLRGGFLGCAARGLGGLQPGGGQVQPVRRGDGRQDGIAQPRRAVGIAAEEFIQAYTGANTL